MHSEDLLKTMRKTMRLLDNHPMVITAFRHILREHPSVARYLTDDELTLYRVSRPKRRKTLRAKLHAIEPDADDEDSFIVEVDSGDGKRWRGEGTFDIGVISIAWVAWCTPPYPYGRKAPYESPPDRVDNLARREARKLRAQRRQDA
jgi:hypothetical protein